MEAQNLSLPPAKNNFLHPFSAIGMIGIDFITASHNILGRAFFFLLPLVVFGFFIFSIFIVWRTQRYAVRNEYKMNFPKKIILRFFLILFFIVILPVFCVVIGGYFLCKSGPAFHFLAATYTAVVNRAASLGYFRFSPVSLAGLRIFAATFLIITWFQWRMAKNEFKTALQKGMIAGILCAIPGRILGVAVGSYALLKSGLGFLNAKYARVK